MRALSAAENGRIRQPTEFTLEDKRAAAHKAADAIFAQLNGSNSVTMNVDYVDRFRLELYVEPPQFPKV